MNVILRLFPAAWRARYGDEFLALLEDQPPGRRRWLDVARCVVAAHLDRSAPPSLEPAPVGRRVIVIGVLVLTAAVAALGTVFLGTASQSAMRRAGDLLAPLLLIVPVAVVAAGTWALWREGDRSLRSAFPAIAVDAFLLTVLGVIATATLTPQLGFFQQAPWIEPRPFVEVITASTDAERLQAIADIAGNALLFVVLGFALALRRGIPGLGWAFGITFALALIIEVAQAALGTGRPADATDVVVRVMGAVIGYAVWRVWIGRSGSEDQSATA